MLNLYNNMPRNLAFVGRSLTDDNSLLSLEMYNIQEHKPFDLQAIHN